MAATDERVLLTQPVQQSGAATPRDQPPAHNSGTRDEHGFTEQEKISIIGRQLEKAFGIEVPPPGNRGDPGDDLPPPDAETGYVPPIQDPYKRAIVYLERHNILQLFQGITADIVYKRPDDPIQFMIGSVEKLLEEEGKQRNKVAKETVEKQKSNRVKPDPATRQEITRPDSITAAESTQEKSVSEQLPGDGQPPDHAHPLPTGDDVTLSEEPAQEYVPEQPALPVSEPSVEAAKYIGLQPAGDEPVLRHSGLPELAVEGSASAADDDHPPASADGDKTVDNNQGSEGEPKDPAVTGDNTADNNQGSEGEPKDPAVTGDNTAEPVTAETVPADDDTVESPAPEATDSREITEDTSTAETNEALEPAETQQTNEDVTAEGTPAEDTPAGVPDHTADHNSGRHDNHEPAKSKTM